MKSEYDGVSTWKTRKGVRNLLFVILLFYSGFGRICFFISAWKELWGLLFRAAAGVSQFIQAKNKATIVPNSIENVPFSSVWASLHHRSERAQSMIGPSRDVAPSGRMDISRPDPGTASQARRCCSFGAVRATSQLLRGRSSTARPTVQATSDSRIGITLRLRALPKRSGL